MRYKEDNITDATGKRKDEKLCKHKVVDDKTL